MTKILMYTKTPQTILPEIFVDNHKLNEVSEFLYLGSMIQQIKGHSRN